MRSRFAPSPTGYLHLGNVWTAMLGWLQTKKAGGILVLRVEDIDEQRSKTEYMTAFTEDMLRLGLTWDEGPDVGGPYGPYIQRERYGRYHEAIERLAGMGLIYPCYCSRARLQAVAGAPHDGDMPVYDGRCYGMSEAEREKNDKPPSLRVHVPDCVISYQDGVYGEQCENLRRNCGDFVVRRADGMYAYQLAVSVDDGAMGITHVLRGRDLLNSTGRQIALMRLLGYKNRIEYTHVPLLVDSEGRRLSKRQHGMTVRDLWAAGADSQQILGYLAYKGGLVDTPGRYGFGELVQRFDTAKIGRTDIFIDAAPADIIKTFI